MARAIWRRKGWWMATGLTITGGSAGGYTTLCAVTFRDAFRAGASHFGVSDLGALARDTHKFESRYSTRWSVRIPNDRTSMRRGRRSST